MKTFLRGLLGCVLFLAAAPALARDAGTLLGVVLNAETKRPEPDVVIVASSPSLGDVGQVVVTTERGEFRIPQLPEGTYELAFEKEGFKTQGRKGLRLGGNASLRVEVELVPAEARLGDARTAATVSVSAQPNLAVAGVSVDSEFIRRIAVNRPGGRGGAARSFESLADASDGYVVDALTLSSSGEDIRRTAPAWTLPLLPVVVPDGTPQTIYTAPRFSWGVGSVSFIPEPEPVEPPPPAPPSIDMSMYFKGHGVNPTIDTAEERISTFSVDVDTASYSMARGMMERGALPPEQAVRVEEFVNSFGYGYTADANVPFRVHLEGFPSPSRAGYHVLRIGLKAREVMPQERKASHLVFVVDISGSMGGDNRLGLVKRALRLLVDELDERDRVSLVVYGSTARVVLRPTPIERKSELLAAIDGLSTGGSTNVQAGLELGYALAAEEFREGGINRVVLCSDGVANNGVTNADGIWERVKGQASRGVTLSTVGFGMGNYNDVLMDRLAQVGEGSYAYVDRLEEAHRIFVENLTGALQVVAKDVKLQVEFSPDAVSRYRLVGYESRMLQTRDFRDDAVDAGEVGAGQSVTALYEVKLREPGAALGALRIRYKAPEGGRSEEVELPLRAGALKPSFSEASPATRLAYVAGAFAEKLRGSYWTRNLSWPRLLSLWEELGEPLRTRPAMKELGALIQKAFALDRRENRFENLAPPDADDPA
ncbi:von Willebrand factor type A domain-containing protein [Myxococcaceae bacterium GXIMD 01537]